ncbi:hypothetical protein RAA17_11300 [Komagataeibacter rhaeticus]|nr:hypothetical protein [Komagataeibacter rhaeticus]
MGFRYPGTGRWALRNLDLTIGAGETVALVGKTERARQPSSSC